MLVWRKSFSSLFIARVSNGGPCASCFISYDQSIYVYTYMYYTCTCFYYNINFFNVSIRCCLWWLNGVVLYSIMQKWGPLSQQRWLNKDPQWKMSAPVMILGKLSSMHTKRNSVHGCKVLFDFETSFWWSRISVRCYIHSDNFLKHLLFQTQFAILKKKAFSDEIRFDSWHIHVH